MSEPNWNKLVVRKAPCEGSGVFALEFSCGALAGYGEGSTWEDARTEALENLWAKLALCGGAEVALPA